MQTVDWMMLAQQHFNMWHDVQLQWHERHAIAIAKALGKDAEGGIACIARLYHMG